MTEVPSSELERAVETQHGGKAVLVAAEPVKEVFNGKTVWEGVVHVFDLEGHPKATRAYSWSSPVEGSDRRRRFYTVLHLGGIRWTRCERLSWQSKGGRNEVQNPKR
jgi:hypothetical protein